MNYRQVAQFGIDQDVVRNAPGEVAEVLRFLNAVPVRVESMFASGKLECIAISESFRVVEAGESVPMVELNVSKDSTGKVDLVEVIYK